MQLLFTVRAYTSILRECMFYPETESGGILIGKRTGGSNFVVVFAIGSGPRAVRSPTRFTPDVSWQQKILERLFNLYAVNYIGSFHRHPWYDQWPSGLDFKTARKIISSPEWNVHEAVFPIILISSQGIQIYPYYLSRDSNGFKQVPWRIVPGCSEIIKTVLQRSTK